MSFEYHIDFGRRIVFARGVGQIRPEDVFGYQQNVWTRAEVKGFNEMVDMSGATRIEDPTPANMQKLAEASVLNDPEQGYTKFAIVAPQDITYGLGRMYEVYRGMAQNSKKHVHVFRTADEACVFLGIKPADLPSAYTSIGV